MNQKANKRIGVQKTYKLYIGGAFPRTESGRYLKLEDTNGELIANLSRASRKDFRNAVTAARSAAKGWGARSAYNRGQILYRLAEMIEGRRAQFIQEISIQGIAPAQADNEVTASVDRLVYYAGWSDKYQQIFSAVNPVNSSHFNFSVLEPMGVVAAVAPEKPSLLGLISVIAPAICGGNTVVVLASESLPLSAVTLAEAIHSSDVPGGVINLLTGYHSELLSHFASHMDVNALVYCGNDEEEIKALEVTAAENLKRVRVYNPRWESAKGQDPYFILDTQETKTTWHPIGI